MHRFLRCSLAAAAAMLMFALIAPAHAAEPGVVYSTSFEKGLKEGGDWGKLSGGATLLHDYNRAHGGEQYIVARGQNSRFQYSLITRSIPVTAGDNYQLSFAYRFTPKIGRNGIMVMIFCFDAQGKAANVKFTGWGGNGNHPYISINGPGTGDWQMFQKEMVIPRGVASIQVYFRHINVPKDQEVDLDDVTVATARPRVTVQYTIDSSKLTLSGKVTVIPASLKPKAVHVLLRDYDPKADAPPIKIKGTDEYNTDHTIRKYGKVQKDLVLPAGTSDFTIDLSQRADRPYTLSASADLGDGKTLNSHDTVESAVFYEMKHPAWAGNKLGLLGANDAPPPPWTPLKYDPANQSVTDWNNRLVFADDLSLRQIDFLHSDEQKLTDAPQQLRIGGKPAAETVSFDKPKVIEQSPHTVTLQTQGQNRDFELSIRASAEFDGFIRYSMQFKALRDCQIGPVEVVFPLSHGVARFVHPFYSGWSSPRVVLDKKNPSWKIADFRASAWIGNEQVGLVCCVNSARPGETIDPAGAKLPSELKDGNWRLTLLPKRDLKAGQTVTVEYGIQPTPTRPLIKGFQDIVMRGKKQSNLELLWAQPTYFPYQGFPIQQDEAITKWSQQTKAQPGSPWAMLYLSTGYHTTTIPAATWFADRWRIKGVSSSYTNEMPSLAKWTGDFVPVREDDPLWQDYFCYELDQLLSHSKVDGLYFDMSALKYGGLFSYRDFQKRIDVILTRHQPKGVIFYHSYSNSAAPYVSFSTFQLRGEAYRQGLAEHDHYLDFLTLDQFRCNETATGQGIIFLPQYRELDKQKNPALAAQTLGLIQLHDMNLYPSWINGDVIHRVRDFKRSFGPLAGAAFHPYWQKQPGLVKVDSPQIVHTTYDRNGDLFAVLFNASKQPVHATLTLDLKSSKSHAVLYDPATGKSQSFDPSGAKEKGISLDLQPSECRWLAVK